ncbi:DUF4132 domain-containing protein [Escherichia coli]
MEQVDANAHSHDASAKKVLVTEEKASINRQAATNGLPWLADNDPIILPPNIARHALSHRLWPGEPVNFQLFLVEHPLVRHLTRRLIWGVYSTENQLLTCFRVAEDNSYSTADDDLFTLPEGDISVGIPHVLEISPTDATAFGQLFADYELLPPFRQLDRNSYALTEAERNASELTRWAGRKCPSGRVMGLANKGWIKGTPQDGGWIGWMIKPLGRWSLIMEIDEGFAVGMSPAELSAEQILSKLWLWEGNAESYGWGSNSTQEAQFSVLDAITASELINDIEALFE